MEMFFERLCSLWGVVGSKYRWSCNHSPGEIRLKEMIHVSVHIDMYIDDPSDHNFV